MIVTDHHRVPDPPPAAAALVNPHRRDAAYPDRRLAGSGVALKVAALLLERLAGIPGAVTTAELADLATIGTVADVAPILGENRSIARLGLDRMRTAPRPGVAALLAAAGVEPAAVSLETVAFDIAPRLNAAGRVGEAHDAANLLLAATADEAGALAAVLETATRPAGTSPARCSTRLARPLPGPIPMPRPPWSGGPGRRASWVSSPPGSPRSGVGRRWWPPSWTGALRASCRAPAGYDLAGALAACGDLPERHGGHRGAASFEVRAERWDAFCVPFLDLVGRGGPPDPRPELVLDLALPTPAADYRLLEHLAGLAPTGPGNPEPIIGVHGLTVTRIRAAAGGHAQLTLRRELDVVDAIAFQRADLVDAPTRATGSTWPDGLPAASSGASRRSSWSSSTSPRQAWAAPPREGRRWPAPSAKPHRWPA